MEGGEWLLKWVTLQGMGDYEKRYVCFGFLTANLHARSLFENVSLTYSITSLNGPPKGLSKGGPISEVVL